ncbi:MAG: hypothetical protein JAZ11_13425 [Candidatus Thiodiazotropha lotti]|nr:hypothetical protein [Candidatus Thiodiazotropha lotti]
MAGLPETGKTTFLGALYHVLESSMEHAIRLRIMPRTREHLEGVRGRWLQVEREGRTSSVSPVMNELNVQLTQSGESLDLRWPDLSGEYFDDMVRKRTLNGEVANILHEANAIMLFIHPDTVTQEPRIHEVEQLTTIIDSSNSDQNENSVTPSTALDWDPMMIPGEVLVVELFQLLLSSRTQQSIDRISIVISAWDIISSTGLESPMSYLDSHLPLLSQFVKALSNRYEIRLFGVSAHGGDPDEDKERLLAKVNSEQRIHVVNGDGEIADEGILAPIRWLIE